MSRKFKEKHEDIIMKCNRLLIEVTLMLAQIIHSTSTVDHNMWQVVKKSLMYRPNFCYLNIESTQRYLIHV